MTPDPAHSAPPDPDQATEAHDQPRSPDEAFTFLRERFEQLVDYASYYLAARRDALKIAATRGILLAVGGILALVILAAVIATSAVLICVGISDGLSVLFGHQWIGELLTGLLIITVIAGSALIVMKVISGRSLRMTVEKYEKLRRLQRERYGRDVTGQSTGGNSHE
jgi:hypothetical protein